MARRRTKGLFSASFRRSMTALTRTALRAGTRAATRATRQALKAAKPAAPPRRRAAATKSGAAATKPGAATAKPGAAAAKRRRAAVTPGAAGGSGGWIAGAALGPTGARRYRLFRPAGPAPATGRALLVLLHGCDQNAAAIARASHIESLAVRENALVLCPEQDRLAHPHGCWNWHETRHGRAHAEAASIVAAIDQAVVRHGADPARVVIAGLSSGASMAALVALRAPHRIAAVAMHSGPAPGSAQSTATLLGALQGRRRPAPLPADTPALPPLLVIQGTADAVVNARNGRASAQLWADAGSGVAGAPRTLQRGTRRAMVLTDFKRGTRLVATLCEVTGLGHAWSGGPASQPYADPTGPDAGRLIWAFAQRCFASAPPTLPA